MGKSYLATALGYKACQDSFQVLYASTAKLMSQHDANQFKELPMRELIAAPTYCGC